MGASAVVIRSAKKINFLPSLMLAKIFTMLFVFYFVESFALSNSDILIAIIMLIPFRIFILKFKDFSNAKHLLKKA